MLSPEARRKADVVVCLLFIALGAWVIWEAYNMPWERGRFRWYTSPGLFPTVVGALLILFSLRVLATALRAGGHRGIGRMLGGWISGLPSNRGIHRVVFSMVWIGLYIFVGLGNFHYQMLSIGFLAVFMGVLWLPGAGRDLLRRLAIVLAVSVSVPLVITHIFSTYLYVPAP